MLVIVVTLVWHHHITFSSLEPRADPWTECEKPTSQARRNEDRGESEILFFLSFSLRLARG